MYVGRRMLNIVVVQSQKPQNLFLNSLDYTRGTWCNATECVDMCHNIMASFLLLFFS